MLRPPATHWQTYGLVRSQASHLTAQRAVPIPDPDLWPLARSALVPQQGLWKNQRVGRFQAAAAQESRGPIELPGSSNDLLGINIGNDNRGASGNQFEFQDHAEDEFEQRHGN